MIDQRTAAKRLIDLLCTIGPAGHAPIAPGTAGALAAMPVAWLMSEAPWWVWLSALVLLALSSVWLVDRYIAAREDKDPKEVVIDEFAGCLVAAAFVHDQALSLIGAFVLFRVFDILKPWPVSLIDRRFKNGWGVVGDDVAAGLAAGAICLLLRHFI